MCLSVAIHSNGRIDRLFQSSAATAFRLPMMLRDGGGNDCEALPFPSASLTRPRKDGAQIAMMAPIKGATKMDAGSKPVDRPDQETVEVRQGTGPRATVSV